MAFNWLKKQNKIIQYTDEELCEYVEEENEKKDKSINEENKKTEVTISIKELQERLTNEEKDKIIGSLRMKLKYAKKLNFDEEDLRKIDNISSLFYNWEKSDSSTYFFYKSINKEITFYNAFNCYQYFDKYLYLIFIYFCEYLSLFTDVLKNEKEIVNIVFDNIYDKESKSNLEMELLNLAFYYVVSEEEFKQDLIEASSFESILDKKWIKDAFLYNSTKKYKFYDVPTYELMLYLYANTLNDSLALSKEQENIYKFIMRDEDINDKDKPKTKK